MKDESGQWTVGSGQWAVGSGQYTERGGQFIAHSKMLKDEG
jgi:hypothetical protein